MGVIWSGTLRKLRVTPGEGDGAASYAFTDGFWDPSRRTADLPLDDRLGAPLYLRFTGAIACVYCGRATKKSFGEGFCFPCFQARAEADQCIVRPELCHFHLPANPCRDEAFALRHCFQPHVLYASLTSAPKIGITRRENIPTRWLDQGATAAIPLAELPDRRSVGLVEARLRDQSGLRDRTHWTRLLRHAEGEGDLGAVAEQVLALLAAWGVAGVLPAADRVVRRFAYPVLAYPDKVVSFNLDKDPRAGGVLQGVKGQYLIFDGGVINARKYTGYQAEVCDAP
jgi:hypothetical protein